MADQPTAAPKPVSTNPSNLFADGIMADINGLRATTAPPEETPPEPSDTPEFEPDAEQEPEEPEAPEGDEAPEEPGDEPKPDEQPAAEDKKPKAPQRTPQEWAAVLQQDGIKRLSEIPPRQHQEVVALYVKDLEAKARESERQTIANQLLQERNLAKFVYDVDAFYANDAEGQQNKLRWLQSNDPNARVYLDGKRYLESVQNQTPQQRVDAISTLQRRSERQWQRASGLDSIQQELAKRHEQGRYPATEEGLAQLEADVDQLLVDAAKGNGTRPAVATTVNRTARRPVTGSGTGSRSVAPRTAPGPDISKIKDPAELMRIGVEQQSRAMASRSRG